MPLNIVRERWRCVELIYYALPFLYSLVDIILLLYFVVLFAIGFGLFDKHRLVLIISHCVIFFFVILYMILYDKYRN